MRIVSMAVAALIAMVAAALADENLPWQTGPYPKSPGNYLEFVSAEGWLAASHYVLDSPCVGDLSTPKCSVETIIACFARNHDDWCSAAMGRPYTFHGYVSGEYTLYRFLLIEPIRKARYFQEPENGGSGAAHGVHTQAGDFHIEVLMRECQDMFQRNGKNICNKRVYKMHYFVSKRADGNWIMIGGFSDYSVKRSDL
jgi:hypothetical protein